jgi:8-amino-7-oxononanoate synthase
MPNSLLDRDFERDITALETAGLRRRLAEPAGVDWVSNDYLGLSRHPAVVEAAKVALDAYGAGAPAARLLGGQRAAHTHAEQTVARWLESEAALLFPSGWQANLAAVGVLSGPGDALLSDALNHASLIDAARLSRAAVHIYRHADTLDLERALRGTAWARRRLIVTESVFSMEGDRAPLATYASLAEQYDAWLLVDEAHAAGLYGPEGAGLGAELERHERLTARIVTGGKALGVGGGFIVGSRALVDALVQRGRSFVFTTAVPPATAAALSAAMRVSREEPWRREHVHRLAARLRARLNGAGLSLRGEGPSVSVIFGSAQAALAVAQACCQSGLDVRAVRPPTVPEGTSRLRLVCHADHRDADVERLAEVVISAARREAQRWAEALPHASPVAKPGLSTAPRLVVVGTDTGVGKTGVSALLVRRLLRQGASARYLKLVQTGLDSDTGAVRQLAQLSQAALVPPGRAYELPASVDQAARAAGVSVTALDLAEAARRNFRCEPAAAWVIECAGGLLVPLNERETQADVLAALAVPLVLVARSGLGTLNHTLLTLEAASRRGLEVRGVFLVGPLHAGNLATLRSHVALPLFTLPFFESLDTAALDGWLRDPDIDGLWPQRARP